MNMPVSNYSNSPKSSIDTSLIKAYEIVPVITSSFKCEERLETFLIWNLWTYEYRSDIERWD